VDLSALREKLFQSGRHIIAGQGDNGKLEIANLFSAKRLAGIHPFFSQICKVGLQLATFGFGIHQKQYPQFPFFAAQLGQRECHLSLWQTGIIIQPNVQFALQRFDEFFIPLLHEMFAERFQGWIIPKLVLRRALKCVP
jgi:hypothetical protein